MELRKLIIIILGIVISNFIINAFLLSEFKDAEICKEKAECTKENLYSEGVPSNINVMSATREEITKYANFYHLSIEPDEELISKISKLDGVEKAFKDGRYKIYVVFGHEFDSEKLNEFIFGLIWNWMMPYPKPKYEGE